MKKVHVAAAAAVSAIIIGGGIFGLTRFAQKDPKEVVIDAFEGLFPENQVYPIDELLGLSLFQEHAGKESQEGGLELVLDHCSVSELEPFYGSGLKIVGKDDVKEKKSTADFTVLYNGMDFASLAFYYGDETLKLALPGLCSEVMTLDISDGLEERMVQSPLLGGWLKENHIDVEGIVDYYANLIEESAENPGDTLDLKGLWKRYQEGCTAQESFKQALQVEKAGKASFPIDGKEVSCQGYEVTIQKAAMIDFLRTSSDFFLQDEEFAKRYLKQLEMSMKLAEMMGETELPSLSAKETLDEMYDEMEAFADEAITVLEQSLSDVQMTVYVAKDGRLAMMEGKTELTVKEQTEPVKLSLQTKGGAYPTQNMTAAVELGEEEPLKLSVEKNGEYQNEKLSMDLTLRMNIDESEMMFAYEGSLNGEDGAFDTSMHASVEGKEVFSAAASGVIDDLEKGVSFHADLDQCSVNLADEFDLTLSGSYYLKPLEEAVKEPEGEEMDVLSASEADWDRIATQIFMNLLGIDGQAQSTAE